MCNPALIAIGLSAFSIVQSGVAQKRQARYQTGVAKFEAQQSENKAQQTRTKGVEEELKERRKTLQLISKQRAQLGASNVELGSGSALQLQQDAAIIGETDALRIRSNFEGAAQSLETGAGLSLSEADAFTSAGKSAFNRSLLSAAGSVAGSEVASKWYNSSSALNTSATITPASASAAIA